MAPDQGEEFADIGVMHDDDPPAERHHREAQDARGMSQRRQREVGRTSPERVAHQRERRHRLDVPTRQHHPLGFPGGAAGARQHDEVVNRFTLKISDVIGQPGLERCGERQCGVEAHQRPQLRQLRADLLHHLDETGMKQQQAAVEVIEDELVLRRLVARIDRTPDRTRARNAEHARKRDRIVAR